ncbi:MAG: hypothetical protein KY410_09110 [Proteobacteria bacterium]|nr:hypothetical protein [Pseudomonadota bacterium]
MRLWSAILLLLLASPVFAGGAAHDGDRNTSTTISCAPDPVDAFVPVTCTAVVSDLYGSPGQRAAPTGTVTFGVVGGPGSFSPDNVCTLAPTGVTGESSCSRT